MTAGQEEQPMNTETQTDPAVAVREILADVLEPAAAALEDKYQSPGLGRCVWRHLTAEAARRIVAAVDGQGGGDR